MLEKNEVTPKSLATNSSSPTSDATIAVRERDRSMLTNRACAIRELMFQNMMEPSEQPATSEATSFPAIRLDKNKSLFTARCSLDSSINKNNFAIITG